MTAEKPASAKPVSPSCERNREPILAVLRERFADRRYVLEIGSGTGQHAVYFADAMPWLTWQCSDQAEYLPGIRMWLDEAGLPNTPPPVELDVAQRPWPAPSTQTSIYPSGQGRFDAAFSANSLHILGWPEVEAFFAGLDAVLDGASTSALRAYAQDEPGSTASGVLVVYGPFNYNGAYTSDSNRAFDGWLKARDPRSGIRDFEAVDALAQSIGLRLIDDIAMPANNRCVAWRRDARRTRVPKSP